MALGVDLFKTMVAGANQIHHYKSADPIATVIGANYFNAITDRLKKGDVIFSYDNNLDTIDMLVVTSETGAAVVTVVNGS